MELLYLLWSIISSTLISLVLSFILPLRYLFRRFSGRRSGYNAGEYVSLYQGTVWHERRRPVHHSFRYSVRYALFDLDNASNVPANHLSAKDARRVCRTDGKVFLLTIPPSVGYEQNPLSLYYCYGVEGSTEVLKKCIAEVTNTPWGERVTFVFNPSSDLVAKPLHVSPFMDMSGNWTMKTTEPGDSLYVAISVQHPELGNYFTATLTAKRVDSLESGDHSVFFWLMPHKVALWIYWHALKLWFKSVPFIPHPRDQNPAYREEALLRDEDMRDEDMRSCPSLGNNAMGNLQVQEKAQDSQTPINRCFSWTDANWPWC